MSKVALAVLAFMAAVPLRTSGCPADELPGGSLPCIAINAQGQAATAIAWNGQDDERLAVAVAWRTAHPGRLRLPRLGEIGAVIAQAQQAGLDPNDLRDHPWATVYVATPNRLRWGRLDSGIAYLASLSGHVCDVNGIGMAGVVIRTNPNIGTDTTDANGFWWIDVPWGHEVHDGKPGG